MKIAKLSSKDIDEFSKLAKEVISTCYHYIASAKKDFLNGFSVKELRKSMNNKNTLYISAKENNKIVGFIKGFYEGTRNSGVFWLEWIGVSKLHRRQGVSKELLAYLISLLKKQKMHKIALAIRSNNNPSMSFFRKNKFKKMVLFKKHWYKEDYSIWHKFI